MDSHNESCWNIIKLPGYVYYNEAIALMGQIETLAGNGIKYVYADLSEVKFLSSLGTGMLAYGFRLMYRSGGCLCLIRVPDSVMEELKDIGLTDTHYFLSIPEYHSRGEQLNAV